MKENKFKLLPITKEQINQLKKIKELHDATEQKVDNKLKNQFNEDMAHIIYESAKIYDDEQTLIIENENNDCIFIHQKDISTDIKGERAILIFPSSGNSYLIEKGKIIEHRIYLNISINFLLDTCEFKTIENDIPQEQLKYIPDFLKSLAIVNKNCTKYGKISNIENIKALGVYFADENNNALLCVYEHGLYFAFLFSYEGSTTKDSYLIFNDGQFNFNDLVK